MRHLRSGSRHRPRFIGRVSDEIRVTRGHADYTNGLINVNSMCTSAGISCFKDKSDI